MSVIGYARVSTIEQDPALQHDALAAAGAVRVFTDYASGATTSRPQLTAALDYLRPGDVLAVWRIDRLGRSVTDLVTLVGDLAARDVQFRFLTEAIDTTTPGGELVFHIFAALAQMERRLISERTRAGLAAARARKGGRPTVMTAHKLAAAQSLRASTDLSLTQIAASSESAAPPWSPTSPQHARATGTSSPPVRRRASPRHRPTPPDRDIHPDRATGTPTARPSLRRAPTCGCAS